MIEYSRGELGRAAKEAGFSRDTFEKVLRLKEVLRFINTDEYLKNLLALKGGTAINMTIFNLPRLSIDIDLDLTQNLSVEEIAETRIEIIRRLREHMSEQGYGLSDASRYSHSLDALLFQYQNAGGNRDNIKVELNYSLRSHIFLPVKRKIVTDIFDDHLEIQTLEPIEIFAAKANALMSRAAARDLYDFNNMIQFGLFDEAEWDMLRKCIIFYACVSAEKVNKSFDTSAIEQLTFSKIRRDLFPVLRKIDNFDLEERKRQAIKFIRQIMILTPQEKEFIEAFEDKEYKPSLLFSEQCILKNISNHPMILWKLQEKSYKF